MMKYETQLILYYLGKDVKTGMMKVFEKKIAINYLLEHGCASIRLRVQREVLKEKNENLENELLEGIQQDRLVKEVLLNQNEEGWFWREFHGTHSHEAGLRILCEKGLDCEHPAVKRGFLALDRFPERVSIGLGRPGLLLDEAKLGGQKMIKAAVFSYGYIEERQDVQEQIAIALQAFKFVSTINSIDEIYETYKEKLVFKPDVPWLSIYHLRLLANTMGWRSAENRQIIRTGIEKMIALSPMPRLMLRNKSQLIAPASFCMMNFKADFDQFSDPDWLMWFHRSELLARMGLMDEIEELRRQKQSFIENYLTEAGLFTRPLAHQYFHNWGAYAGLALEQDWKELIRRICDLTFRALLILN
jgi:hypothetical protein